MAFFLACILVAFWARGLFLDMRLQWKIAQHNASLQALEHRLAANLSAFGAGCSDEWKRNHIRYVTECMDASDLGYLDRNGVKQTLDKEAWIGRIVEMSEELKP